MWNTIYTIVLEFQTLIAGSLAIAAAGLAYMGVNKQIQAAMESEQRNQNRLKKGAAAAISSEALAIAIDGQAFRTLLKTADIELIRDFYPKLITEFPVYDSNPAAVAHFPPHLANDTVQLFRDYRIAITLWATNLESPGNQEKLLQAISENFDRLILKALTLVVQLHTEAEMPEQPTLELWAKSEGMFEDFPEEMGLLFQKAPQPD